MELEANTTMQGNFCPYDKFLLYLSPNMVGRLQGKDYNILECFFCYKKFFTNDNYMLQEITR